MSRTGYSSLETDVNGPVLDMKERVRPLAFLEVQVTLCLSMENFVSDSTSDF